MISSRQNALAALAALAAFAVFAPVINSPSANADTNDYEIRWTEIQNFDPAHPVCNPVLIDESQPYFHLNGWPLPTYTLRHDTHLGTTWDFFVAPYDAALLRLRSNELQLLHLPNDTLCKQTFAGSVDVYNLTLSEQLFERGYTRGKDGLYVEEVFDVDLEDIDPDLAEDVERARQAISESIGDLDDYDGDITDFEQALADLAQFDLELEQLLASGFGDITASELQAFLDRWSGISPDVTAAIRNVLNDILGDIGSLREEIERLSHAVDELTDATDDLIGSAVGLDPKDEENFRDETNREDTGEVPLPDDLPDQGCDGSADPFAPFAQQIVADLLARINSYGEITDRYGFLRVYVRWRQTTDEMEAGLRRKAVCGEEWNNFLRAKAEVIDVVDLYLDEQGWMRDTNVPPELRTWFRNSMDTVYADQATRIQNALNILGALEGHQAASIYGMLFVISEMNFAVRSILENEARRKMQLAEKSWLDSTVSFLETAASVGWDIATTLTPLGDIIDACEALTGRAGCRPSGRKLSWAERAAAAGGIFVWGSTSALRRIGRKAEMVSDWCRRSLLGPGVLAAELGCDVSTFFDRLADAKNDVRKVQVRSNVRKIDHGNGSFTAIHTELGYEVVYNQARFVQYPRRYLYPGPQRAQVWVEFVCNRSSEFSEANYAAGFTRGSNKHPDTHTWHHTERFRERNGRVEILMELVEKPVHKWSSHTGGIAIGQKILGRKCS